MTTQEAFSEQLEGFRQISLTPIPTTRFGPPLGWSPSGPKSPPARHSKNCSPHGGGCTAPKPFKKDTAMSFYIHPDDVESGEWIQDTYSGLDPDTESRYDNEADRRWWLASGCPLPIVERPAPRVDDGLPF